MWSGPRNISSALMRSFGNRSDCFVSDEPFYPYFLTKTKLKHPLYDEIIQSGLTDYKQIIKYITGVIPSSKKIWYQKHMAHHILDIKNIDWVKHMKNCILIRHPSDVITSYSKQNKIENIEQLGYIQQIQIYKRLTEYLDIHPIIIDAEDLLSNPLKMLTVLCRKLQIKFDPKMLSWSIGIRKTDGVWAKHWYKNVESSSGFKPYNKTDRKIPAKYHSINDICLEHYNFLHEKRIIINNNC